MEVLYGMFFGSDPHSGFFSYATSGGDTQPIAACIHGSLRCFSILHDRHAFAAVWDLEYLKIIIGKKRLSSVVLPTGPTGRCACPMSATMSFSFWSGEFFAA